MVDPALVARFKAALERLNPEGGKIGLAVSGGPDSMAMLLLAQAAIPGAFEVATVDHGLRPEAKDECALVAAACAERGVPCAVLTVEVGAGNVQAKAREARYAALIIWAQARGIDALATAHHMEDQAETLLLRLNRGSGVSGLGSIRHSVLYIEANSLFYVIRPLLEFRRQELRSVLRGSGERFASDPSNLDDRFDRVRMRKAMEAAYWLDIPRIADSARHLDEADQALSWAANEIYRRQVRRCGGGFRYELKSMRPPRLINLKVVEHIFELLGSTPRGGHLSDLVDALSKGQGSNVAGVLGTVEGPDWVFRPEPPRRT